MIQIPKKRIIPFGLFFLIICLLIFFFLTPKIYRAHNKFSKIINVEYLHDNNFTLSSIFTTLNGTLIQIPDTERGGFGGALTSWDSNLVVMTHEGKIYFIGEGEDPTPILSKIEAPDNGLDEYINTANKTEFSDLKHNFDKIRYNDISSFKYKKKRGLLVSYTKFNPEKTCYTNAISRIYIPNKSNKITSLTLKKDDWDVLYQTAPCLPFKKKLRAIEGHMSGARMLFDGSDTVFLASGDYHWDGSNGPLTLPNVNAKTGLPVPQDPNADYGKVIAIHVDTGISHQISRGHRNMQGITSDRNGDLWVVEHGVRGGDELNKIVEGKDYGWPVESYGTLYTGSPIPTVSTQGRHNDYQRPMIAWLPSLGISGLTKIENFLDEWDGDFLASSLVSQQLIRIRVADNRVIFTEFIDVGYRVRYVHQHTDGRIVLWTDDKKVIFLSLGENKGMQYINELLKNNKFNSRAKDIIESCMECHSFNKDEHNNAPSLANVFNSEIGSTKFKKYSSEMRSDNRRWTRELLSSFLKNPQAVIPGTTMPNPNIQDSTLRDEVIDILDKKMILTNNTTTH
ncbi:MAG: PQQ-dependent sugar dehydrogenase [Methylococcales bacterium]|nr:PQQ-dependent sugar dehydrogenase [Methylococcales bacterium]